MAKESFPRVIWGYGERLHLATQKNPTKKMITGSVTAKFSMRWTLFPCSECTFSLIASLT